MAAARTRAAAVVTGRGAQIWEESDSFSNELDVRYEWKKTIQVFSSKSCRTESPIVISHFFFLSQRSTLQCKHLI